MGVCCSNPRADSVKCGVYYAWSYGVDDLTSLRGRINVYKMGAAKVVPSERSKSHLSYYVAMAVIIGLLVLLCCYACYFFINKIRELSADDSPSRTPSTPCPKKAPVSYPVQPVVRDSATAMAALCRQLPAGYTLQGDQVFPAPRSPDPRPAHATPPDTRDPRDAPEAVVEPMEKLPEVPQPVVPSITLEAAR